MLAGSSGAFIQGIVMSYTTTATETFTITHARRLGSKIAADMHLCQQYHGKPSDTDARAYAEELSQLLNGGYLACFEFGYRCEGVRVVTWQYEVHTDGSIASDDRPGKLPAWIDVREASFYSYLSYSSSWWQLSDLERHRIRDGLPVDRKPGNAPVDGEGYWSWDKSYAASGVGLQRRTFQPRQ